MVTVMGGEGASIRGDWDGGGNVGGPARTVEMGLWVGYDPGPGDVQVGVLGGWSDCLT